LKTVTTTIANTLAKKVFGKKKKKKTVISRGATTLSITALSITTFSIMALSIKGLFVTLSINDL
jgi:hypothetical protein